GGAAHRVSRGEREIRRGESHRRIAAATTLRPQRRRELGLHAHPARGDSCRQVRGAQSGVGKARLADGRRFLPQLPPVHRVERRYIRGWTDDSRRLPRLAQEEVAFGVRASLRTFFYVVKKQRRLSAL